MLRAIILLCLVILNFNLSRSITLSGCRARYEEFQLKCLNYFTKNFDESDHLFEIVTPLEIEFRELKVVELIEADFIPKIVFLNQFLERFDLRKEGLKVIQPNTFQDAANLKYLFLSSNQLEKLENDCFMGASNLLKIDLSDNRILEIEEGAFKGLINLKRLNLQNNRIQSLTGFLEPLESLLKIILSGNEIQIVNKEFFRKNRELQEIVLTGNKIKELEVGTFENLENLKSLDLGENQIKKIPPHIFNSLVNLEELHLESNQLETLDENLFQLNLKLETIALHENKLASIPQSTFSHLTNLQVLFLSSNICIDESYTEASEEMREIENALKSCTL